MQRIRHLIAGRGPAISSGELAAELDAAKLSDEEFEDLAIDLGVTPGILRDWASGAAPIPHDKTKLVRHSIDAYRRIAALRVSGLPNCEFAETSARQIEPLRDAGKPKALKRLAAQLKMHNATCQTCRARSEYIAGRFGPAQAYPSPLWIRVARAVALNLIDPPKWIPAWARPAAMGATGGLFIALGLGVAFGLSWIVNRTIHSDVSPLLTSARLLSAATLVVASAAGGFVLSIADKILGHQTRLALYVMSISVATAFLATCYLAVTVFGSVKPFEDPTLILFGVVVIGLFGFILGPSWFSDDDVPGLDV